MIWCQGDPHLFMYWRLDILSFDVLSWTTSLLGCWQGMEGGIGGRGQMSIICIFIGGRGGGKCPASFLLGGGGGRRVVNVHTCQSFGGQMSSHAICHGRANVREALVRTRLSIGIILSRQGTTKTLIRLRKWQIQIFSWRGSIVICKLIHFQLLAVLDAV